MSGALLPPQGTIHRSIRLLGEALGKMGARMPARKVEDLAITINRGMTMQGRSFHTPEHVFDLADPDNPYITLAAFFHDLVYVNVDQGFPPGIRETIAASIKMDGERLSIRPAVERHDKLFRICLEVFGLSPGDALAPSSGMNEFLSALVMCRILEGAVAPGGLLLVVACIEATIPFRPLDRKGTTAAELLELRMEHCNRVLKLGLPASKVADGATWAVSFANRDVENFCDPEVSRFLDNTWKLLPETNPSLRTQGIYSIQSYRKALGGMHEFMQGLDPRTIFGRHRDVPSAATYQAMLERGERNVLMAREYLGIKLLTSAILEALAEISGGDAPMSLFMGDIDCTDPGGRLEHYLPSPEETGLAVDGTLRDLLAVGRASVSSFDLQNAPLSLFVYQCLGTQAFKESLEDAKRMFRRERTAQAFLDTLPGPMVAAIAHAAARMAFTRGQVLDGYADRRERV